MLPSKFIYSWVLKITSCALVFWALAIPIMGKFDNTNILVEEAVNHIYQQRYQQALNLLKQAYEQSPRHPGVHFNLGRLYELTGNFSEALKEFQIAASLDPSNVAARRGIARCSVELKRRRGIEQYQVLETAAQEIISNQGTRRSSPSVVISPSQPRQTVSQPPTQPQPRQTLQAPLQSFTRQPADISNIKVLQAITPSTGPQESSSFANTTFVEPITSNDYATLSVQNRTITGVNGGRLPSAPTQTFQPLMPPASPNYSDLTNVVSNIPPASLEGLNQVRNVTFTEEETRAENLIERGEYKKAFDLLEGLLNNDPNNARALFLLGKLFCLKGELFNGIKYLEEAIKVDEKLFDAYYLLAQSYSRVNLLDDAIRNYQIYFGVRPQAGVALEMARVYERMGRQEQAREYYAKANAMNPGNPNLQARLSQAETDVANDLYLRANQAFSTNDFAGAATLFEQALATRGLDATYRRDAERKLQAARLRAKVQTEQARPAVEGFKQSRATYGTVNLLYHQLTDISFKTKFTGPVIAEWKAYVARRFTRYGQDFLVMIKVLNRDEEERLGREQRDFRLNPNFTNQPVFLLTAPSGTFPPFIEPGKFITFTGRTEWRFYDVINDLGQSMKLPAFEYISAYPS